MLDFVTRGCVNDLLLLGPIGSWHGNNFLMLHMLTNTLSMQQLHLEDLLSVQS
jgi:hypothetical protein